MVESVAKKLSGSNGPTGVDATTMAAWLLKYGGHSAELRNIVAKFTEWLANSFPPWAAYRAMTWNRMIGLGKSNGGVRPIHIGDIWRRTFCKVFLEITRPEATRAAGIDQLCCGLEAGIEAGIHAMKSLYDANVDNDDWGILFLDACNAFNESNRKMMV